MTIISFPLQMKKKDNQENSNDSNSDIKESFIALKPDKITNSNSSLINLKRERESSKEGTDFSCEKKKDTSIASNEDDEEELMQKIEEERKKLDKLYEKLENLKKKSKEEIDKKILQGNNITNNLNMNKNELKKSIRNILQTTANKQLDIKEIENIYNSLNEKSKMSLNNSLNKLEEELNKETYLKTEILKKSYDKTKPKTIELVEIKEEEEIDNVINDNNMADNIEEINNKICKGITEQNKPNNI